MANNLKPSAATNCRFAKPYDSSPANQPCSQRRPHGGFTLLELLIVIAIIATLVAIAAPAYDAYLQKAKLNISIVEIKEIEKQLLLFEMHNNRLPDTLAEAGIDMIDQWRNPYQYTLIRGKPLTGPDKVTPRKDKSLHPLNSDYDLYSMGPDGLTNTALTAKASHDDIIRAGDGSYYGIAVNY